MMRASQPSRKLTFGALLFVLAIVAYVPIHRAGFIIDDETYVLTNQLLRSADGLVRLWADPGASPQYYPLAFTTFWIEYQLWGPSPLGFHLVNVLLHAGNAVLVWLFLLRIGLPGAWLAGALFAVHPVHAESVAWIAERKNVLSGLFYLGALFSFLEFADLKRPRSPSIVKPPREPKTGPTILQTAPPAGLQTARAAGQQVPRSSHRRSYILSLVLFAAALTSKIATVTLPAVLLLLVWWRRGRLDRRVSVSVLPFLALGAVLGLVTLRIERGLVARESIPIWDGSVIDRLVLAGRAVWFYLVKLIWPHRLSFCYPRWSIDAHVVSQWLPLIALLAGLAVLWLGRRRMGRGPLVAALCFVATLAPTLGFVDLYYFRYSFVANHFVYLASIAVFAFAAARVAALLRMAQPGRWTFRGRAVLLGSGLVVVALIARTWTELGKYRDMETLSRSILRDDPANWLGNNNLGKVYLERGDLKQARSLFEAAAAVAPSHIESQLNLAIVLMNQGRFEDALVHARKATELRPSNKFVYNTTGEIQLRAQRPDLAVPAFRQALAIDPGYLEAEVNLGTALAQLGEAGPAEASFLRVLSQDPNQLTALANLGVLLAQQARWDEARATLERALAIDPGNPTLLQNLRLVRERMQPPPPGTR